MTTAAASAKLKRYPKLKFQACFVFFYLVLLQVTVARNTSTTDDVITGKVQANFAIKSNCLKKMSGYEKINLAISLTKDDTKEGKNPHDYTDNEIVKYFAQEKLRLMKDLLPQRTERKQKRLVKTNIKKLDIDAKRLKDINPMNVDEEKNQKKSAVEWLMETVIYVVCAVSLAGILVLNISYLVHLLTKNGLSKVTSQNRTNLSSSSQMTIMTLALLLFHVPVGGDGTGMSASKGTYFQNEAQGRYLQDYVIESFSHMSLFQCQIQCVSRLPKCRSMNYIESENGSSICEINKERQNCALPGEYISRENSFYLETMPETDDEVWCSTCSFRGVIVNTNEQPGFACSCKEGFYGNKCQDGPGYKLKFPGDNTQDYVKVNGVPDMTAITTCLWVRTTQSSSHTASFVSYAQGEKDNTLLIGAEYGKLTVYMMDKAARSGCSISSIIQVNDGKWHHVCFTWQSQDGKYSMYKDGKLEKQGYLECTKGETLLGGGTLVLGQDQDKVGGGFQLRNAFAGEMAELNIWYCALSQAIILEMSKSCRHSSEAAGNVKAWSDFESGIAGELKKLKSTCCDLDN